MSVFNYHFIFHETCGSQPAWEFWRAGLLFERKYLSSGCITAIINFRKKNEGMFEISWVLLTHNTHCTEKWQYFWLDYRNQFAVSEKKLTRDLIWTLVCKTQNVRITWESGSKLLHGPFYVQSNKLLLIMQLYSKKDNFLNLHTARCWRLPHLHKF